ncbi:TetR/AcrR family transcriptional regulator, partial [Streptomyces sp. SID8455]|nr:TetR/AcrR family transcriptional regulator [Streptomyces sp. SID8455]
DFVFALDLLIAGIEAMCERAGAPAKQQRPGR